MEMKKISFLVPCFREEDNIKPMAEALTEIMKQYEGKYDYEIVFRDNNSPDRSVEILRELAAKDKHIKAIVNCRNYGINPLKNTFVGRLSGEVVIQIPCDFQEPPELIPEFIYWWEQGYQVVFGQKTGSAEGKLKYGLRQLYYKIIGNLSDIPQVPNLSGIMLMSTKLYNIRSEHNIYEPMRYFLTDVGCEMKLIQYKQQARRSGKSSYNIWRSLSFAITSMVSTSTVPLRMATLCGVILSALSFLVGVVYLIFKLIWWNRFAAGTTPILIGIFFIGSIQLLFIGILGEYIADILRKVTPLNPPMVKEMLNYDEADEDQYYIRRVETPKTEDTESKS